MWCLHIPLSFKFSGFSIPFVPLWFGLFALGTFRFRVGLEIVGFLCISIEFRLSYSRLIAEA